MYTQPSGIVCFRLIFTYIASLFYFVHWTVLGGGGFLFSLCQVGINRVRGGRRSFRIRGFHLLSGGLLSSAYAGRWGGTRDGDLEGDDIFFILGANLLKDFSCYLATGIGSASGFTFTTVILISFVIF